MLFVLGEKAQPLTFVLQSLLMSLVGQVTPASWSVSNGTILPTFHHLSGLVIQKRKQYLLRQISL